ncbi:MAG: tRNA (guanosine(46)-N7)-methyltransferase TrmB [Gammaproteobacteria bacterium]|nr:tRNA (guanosine(46)-N7)-methyltransferase TrmB [Gammaproteobacteria bacterium]
MLEDKQHHRKIRSFVKRAGRLTPGQQRALNELLPEFGIDLDSGLVDFNTLFTNNSDVILEIGFGMGQSLLQQARENPDHNYLGIEVHSPGVGSLLNGMKEHGLDNIRVSMNDAVEVLENNIPEQSLSCVQLFFPDPWHKKRHHKRRLVQKDFVEAILKRLKPAGVFYLATDWENYAEHMLEVISAVSGFSNLSKEGNYLPRPDTRPLTKFEQRGQRLGHGVWDLMFIRN